MTTTTGVHHPDESADLPDEVVDAIQAKAEAADREQQQPPWADLFVWRSLWKVVAVGLAVAVGLVIAFRAQHLLRLLVISVFLALAMVPAVNYMQRRWGWRRGAAVGLIYAGFILFVVLMVLVLIPGIIEFAEGIGEEGDQWVADLNEFTEDTFGFTVVDTASAEDAAGVTNEAMSEWAERIVGLASKGIGLIFDLGTIGLFTFYFAADYQRIERALMSRMRPTQQKIYGWVSDTALEQTGGYFYSRMALMLISSSLFFVAMVLVGMPVLFALPLSVFQGFVSTFIPAVGTYIGAGVPIVVTLAVQGALSALILLAFTLLYQQLENYWLSPKLSAQTMELNGGVAFGAALAGGAIAGPMGAFMSLPVAALITSVISNLTRTYDVVYESKYDTTPGEESASVEATDSIDGG